MSSQQYVLIFYQDDKEQREIETQVLAAEDVFFVVDENGNLVKSIKPNTVRINMNKHGAAFLASLVSDFLVSQTPWDIKHQITHREGLSSESPTITLVFDPSLDEQLLPE